MFRTKHYKIRNKIEISISILSRLIYKMHLTVMLNFINKFYRVKFGFAVTIERNNKYLLFSDVVCVCPPI